MEILHRLADGGNTVVVIEHNLDVIKTADYIIDMGPEGGDRGGTVIAKGTPEEIVKVKKSYTGYYVKRCWRRTRNYDNYSDPHSQNALSWLPDSE